MSEYITTAKALSLVLEKMLAISPPEGTEASDVAIAASAKLAMVGLRLVFYITHEVEYKAGGVVYKEWRFTLSTRGQYPTRFPEWANPFKETVGFISYTLSRHAQLCLRGFQDATERRRCVGKDLDTINTVNTMQARLAAPEFNNFMQILNGEEWLGDEDEHYNKMHRFHKDKVDGKMFHFFQNYISAAGEETAELSGELMGVEIHDFVVRYSEYVGSPEMYSPERFMVELQPFRDMISRITLDVKVSGLLQAPRAEQPDDGPLRAAGRRSRAGSLAPSRAVSPEPRSPPPEAPAPATDAPAPARAIKSARTSAPATPYGYTSAPATGGVYQSPPASPDDSGEEGGASAMQVDPPSAPGDRSPTPATPMEEVDPPSVGTTPEPGAGGLFLDAGSLREPADKDRAPSPTLSDVGREFPDAPAPSRAPTPPPRRPATPVTFTAQHTREYVVPSPERMGTRHSKRIEEQPWKPVEGDRSELPEDRPLMEAGPSEPAPRAPGARRRSILVTRDATPAPADTSFNEATVRDNTRANTPADSVGASLRKRKQPAGKHEEPAGKGKEPAGKGKKPAAKGKKPAAKGKQPAAKGKEPAPVHSQNREQRAATPVAETSRGRRTTPTPRALGQ